MQALIDFIVRNLLALWPIARIYDWQQGILVRGGRIIRPLAPGLHWRWWFVDEVKTWPSTEQGIDLDAGSVVTQDGQSISVSANISYRMVSMEKMFRSLWNTDKTIALYAIGQITSDCATMTWAELRDRRRAEASLLSSLNSVMASRGVEIMGIRLTDCVPSRAHRFYHDGKVT